jgi:hypothetical protein
MSAPTFAKDGIVIIIVLKITRKNLAFFISLNILPILKARATVDCFGPNEPDNENPKIRVMQEITTMIKSKMFQPFEK